MGYGGTGADLPGLLPLDKKPHDSEYIFRSGLIEDDYEVDKDPIARGKFASVRLARHRITKQIFAAKYLRRRGRATSLENEARHEIAVLLLGRADPYIIHLHHVYEARSEYVIVLEFGSGGDLQGLLDDQSKFSEKTVRDLLIQVLRGLSFLHERRIAHLDIKPQNLVLMGPTPDDGVKLVDFGLSRLILDNVELQQIMGTPDYVAPEVINFEPVGLPTDLWSIGVLTYVFLTGCTPFGGNTDQETFVNITQGEFDFPEDLFEDISKLAKDFISSLLLKSTHSRMTVDQSLNDIWINGTVLSEVDSGDSGYCVNMVNGSPPGSNQTNGYMSYSISSLTSQCSVIKEDPLDHQDPVCDMSSFQNFNQSTPSHHKTRPRKQDLNATLPRLSQNPHRKHKVSTGHMSINVMESLKQQQVTNPQHYRSFRRNSLVVGDQKTSDIRETPTYGSLRGAKHLARSSAIFTYDEEHWKQPIKDSSSSSKYSENSHKTSPEIQLDRNVLRKMAKPWENLCDGSLYRAITQLQSNGTPRKKNYFGMRPEMSYSMCDIKTATENSYHHPGEFNLPKIHYANSDLSKSKPDLRGPKQNLRKNKSDLMSSKSELKASNTNTFRTPNGRSHLRDSSRLDESRNISKSEKSYRRDIKKSKHEPDASKTRKQKPAVVGSHDAIMQLNMSLSRLDLTKDRGGDEESEERDIVYGDFTLPRRFNRASSSHLLRGNSFHMSFRLPKKKNEKM